MKSRSPLRVFTLEYDAATNSISPHVRYISPDNVLKDLYRILNCQLVTCTEIEVNGNLFDVWSDDEALLKDKPAPNLYIDDDFHFPHCSAFYVPCYKEVWGETVSTLTVAASDFNLDGKFLLNHDTRQFVDLNEYKAASVDKDGWCIHPLPLLTAVGNGRGGGDFHEGNTGYENVGIWVWQLLSFADKPPKGFSKFPLVFKEDAR